MDRFDPNRWNQRRRQDGWITKNSPDPNFRHPDKLVTAIGGYIFLLGLGVIVWNTLP